MSLNSDSKHVSGIFFAKLKKGARETHIINYLYRKERNSSWLLMVKTKAHQRQRKPTNVSPRYSLLNYRIGYSSIYSTNTSRIPVLWKHQAKRCGEWCAQRVWSMPSRNTHFKNQHQLRWSLVPSRIGSLLKISEGSFWNNMSPTKT